MIQIFKNGKIKDLGDFKSFNLDGSFSLETTDLFFETQKGDSVKITLEKENVSKVLDTILESFQYDKLIGEIMSLDDTGVMCFVASKKGDKSFKFEKRSYPRRMFPSYFKVGDCVNIYEKVTDAGINVRIFKETDEKEIARVKSYTILIDFFKLIFKVKPKWDYEKKVAQMVDDIVKKTS